MAANTSGNKPAVASALPFTIYEVTPAIGIRIEQLARGAPALVETDGLTDPIQIAEREYKEQRLPFAIVRSNKEVVKMWK